MDISKCISMCVQNTILKFPEYSSIIKEIKFELSNKLTSTAGLALYKGKNN